jgi:predicted GH43/DUF377 family glycosyl hydrolase
MNNSPEQVALRSATASAAGVAAAQALAPVLPLTVVRRPERFISDDKRVITRFFEVGGETRARSVIERVLRLPEPEVQHLLQGVLKGFNSRHRDIEAVFQRHFNEVRRYVPGEPDGLDRNRKLLIGSYFTMEYSIESAALFNPSMVLHPDQSNLADGEARFIMSLRATGEGHLSSIVFRTGTVDRDGRVHFDAPSRFAARLHVKKDRRYEKKLFSLKLTEMGAYSECAQLVLEQVAEFFSYDQLDDAIASMRGRECPTPLAETTENLLWLARSNYHLDFPKGTDPSEIVIFPTSDNESKGIEDVRLTRFIDDDGGATYFGTYTAYNGFRILPQLIETTDFTDIQVHTLNGRYVQNKGMALFPRKINGQYYMISRIDGENMYLMRSDNVHFWNECTRLRGPRYPWELVQIGNCGPPIETEAGWILLTHGVGPMRQYCIGASLLDRDDPSKVIGHLPEPLLIPQEDERDGYVPNVVYSCGALVHEDHLVIPYAINDTSTTFASVRTSELVDSLTRHGS